MFFFYRHPNSSVDIYSNIEESIYLAVDPGISDIIITGGFNCNVLNSQTSKKIDCFCTNIFFVLARSESSHLTEHSSLINCILVSKREHLILQGVGDPFLNQKLLYHCPIWILQNFQGK